LRISTGANGSNGEIIPLTIIPLPISSQFPDMANEWGHTNEKRRLDLFACYHSIANHPSGFFQQEEAKAAEVFGK